MSFVRIYGKGIVAVLAVVASGLVAGLEDGALSGSETINLAIQALGAASVLTAAQIPGHRYIKWVIAVFTAAAVAASSYVAGGFTFDEVLQIVVAGIGALFAIVAPAMSSTGVGHGVGVSPARNVTHAQ